jgi:iron complex transport system substrate-binding protein
LSPELRIVSLTCSNTEIVCALGAGHELVGVDDHSDFPIEIVARLPRVGPDLSVDIERIAALRPDLVLASLTVPGHERNVAALETAGLRFLAPEPRTLGDVYADIRLIGAALGRERESEALIASMKRQIVPISPEWRPRVLVEWWPKPIIVPGRQSWATDLIEAAGGENPLSLRDVKSAPISDEEARSLEPDAVVISWCGVRPEKYRPDVVMRRAAFRDLPALAAGNVFSVPEAFLGRPGPRLTQGYQALCDVFATVRQRAQ